MRPLAEPFDCACYGVGFAALRLHGTSIWALVVLHAITDIALPLGDISSAWRWGIMIGGDTVLLIYGLIILRKTDRPAATMDSKVQGVDTNWLSGGDPGVIPYRARRGKVPGPTSSVKGFAGLLLFSTAY